MALAIKADAAEADEDWFGQMDTQLRYYLHLTGDELDRLSLEEWVRLWCHLRRIREAEAASK